MFFKVSYNMIMGRKNRKKNKKKKEKKANKLFLFTCGQNVASESVPNNHILFLVDTFPIYIRDQSYTDFMQ